MIDYESFKRCKMPDGVKIIDVQPQPDRSCMATILIDPNICSPDVLEAILGVRELGPIQTINFSIDIEA